MITLLVALSLAIATAALSWRTREARALFRSQPNSFAFSISVDPSATGGQDPGFELRSVLLHTRPTRIEPQALGPLGHPFSADNLITDVQARAIVEVLARDGFFERANAGQDVSGGPSKHAPHVDFQVSARRQDDLQPTEYVESFDWNPTIFSRLARIRGVLDGEAGKALDTLIDEVEESLRPAAG